MKLLLSYLVAISSSLALVSSFVVPDHGVSSSFPLKSTCDDNEGATRRSFVLQGLGAMAAISNVRPSVAAVGSLPEFADTNAILQGLTVNVADPSQQKSMIEFLTQGFGFEVLRQRINGPIEETVS